MRQLTIFAGYQFESQYFDRAHFEDSMDEAVDRASEGVNRERQDDLRLVLDPVALKAGEQLNRQIIDHISHADICIFELSDLNMNVLYELGLAVGHEKPSILLLHESVDRSKLPSDILGSVYLIYRDRYQLLRKLGSEILDQTREILARPPMQEINQTPLLPDEPQLYFSILNKYSGKCLDAPKGITEDGTTIQQWDYWEGSNQLWKLRRLEDGYYAIISKENGKCLQVSDGSDEENANVVQWKFLGKDHQQWRLKALDDGSYQIIARHSNQSLDVLAAGTENFDRIVQYHSHGAQNQRWWIRLRP